MSLSELDLELARRCLEASANGPFFEEPEFQTLFGVGRAEVRAVLLDWSRLGLAGENARLAVLNSFTNLLGYPHGMHDQLHRWVGVSEAELEAVARRLRHELG